MKLRNIIIGTIAAVTILKSGFYVNPVKVVDNDNGIVYVQDYSGNVWSYTGVPEIPGTTHTLTMFTKFNKNVEDDIIITKLVNNNENYICTNMDAVPSKEDILFAEYMAAIEKGYRE